MMKMDNKKSKKGTRRIEAWIYTVITPIIEALKIEKSFLKDKNWTWRYYTKNLEFILPLEGYVDSASIPNFEDFFNTNLKIERKRKKREDLRAALTENCQIAFKYLTELEDFRDNVKSSLSMYGEYPGGAVTEKDFHKLIAQYIINDTKEMPQHYTTSQFWSKFGNEFLEFRTGEKFEELDASGKQLEVEDERFLITLENLRSVLCEKYDIPAAPVFYYDWGRHYR